MATIKQLQERKKMIEAETAPLIERRDELAKQAAKIEIEMSDLAVMIKAVQGSELFEIDQEIARLARLGGAKSMRDA